MTETVNCEQCGRPFEDTEVLTEGADGYLVLAGAGLMVHHFCSAKCANDWAPVPPTPQEAR